MATERNNPNDNRLNNREVSSSVPNDLPDSEKDKEKLKPEKTTLDLPDVKDIPGQEFVHAMPPGEMADTTAASDDEEGVRVFGDDEREKISAGGEGDVDPDEREALRDTTYMPTKDEDNLRRARMDNKDFDGDPLNEGSFGEGQQLSGSDLDVPANKDETRTTSMGQGDEENKYYSLGGEDNEENENRDGR